MSCFRRQLADSVIKSHVFICRVLVDIFGLFTEDFYVFFHGHMAMRFVGLSSFSVSLMAVQSLKKLSVLY